MAQRAKGQAICLRSVDYGDADRIVTALVRDAGKVALIARSARRSKRRFAGALQAFSVVSMEYHVGGGDVGTLHAGTTERVFLRILGSLEAMRCAGAALESVRALTPERHPEPAVFDLCVELFEALDAAAGSASPSDTFESLRTCFLARLLALLGLAPQLDRCGKSGEPVPDGRAVLFDPQLASVV